MDEINKREAEPSRSRAAIEAILKLVRTFRLTSGIPERARLSDEIFIRLEPELRIIVFSKVTPQDAEEVMQEVMQAIAAALGNFEGNSRAVFWGWCHRFSALYGLTPEEVKIVEDAIK